MSNLAISAAYGAGRSPQMHRFKKVVQRVDFRVGEAQEVQRLSLSSEGHLYARSGAADRQQASRDTEQRSLLVRRDDLVINPMWLTGGSLAVSDKSGAVSPDYRVFAPDRTRVSPRYLHHLLRSRPYRDQYDLFVRANTTFDRRIQQGDLDQLPLWLPSVEEQRRIADFLDDRVARVDQIITARRRQLALETERFRSVLESSLGPGRPRQPLKHLISSVTSGPRGWGDLVADEGTPFVRITNLSALGIEASVENLTFVTAPEDAEAARARLSAGDVLLSITAVFGEVAVWRGGPGTFSQHVARIRPLRVQDADWIAWCLQSRAVHDQYRLLAYGGTKVGMGLEQVRNLTVPQATLADRDAASLTLSDRWSTVSSLRDGLERSIALLAEYKQSLITAAVTGELDMTTAGSGIPG